MIVTEPAHVLHAPCSPIPRGNEVLSLAIAEKLRAAMVWSAAHGKPAAGLAAPQIGASVRVFVLAGYEHAFVNPTVAKVSDETAVAIEECLSIPGVRVQITRPKWVKLSFTDEHGTARALKIHGFGARAALHELDHLDGILITGRGNHQPATYRNRYATVRKDAA